MGHAQQRRLRRIDPTHRCLQISLEVSEIPKQPGTVMDGYDLDKITPKPIDDPIAADDQLPNVIPSTLRNHSARPRKVYKSRD